MRLPSARTSRPVVAALAFVLAASTTLAFAQDRLFVGTGELGAFGHFAQRLGEAPGAAHGRLVAGGRYVVAGSEFAPSPPVFDTATGQQVPTPDGRVIEVDPRRPRIFIKSGTVVSVFDLERQTTTALAEVPADVWPSTLAAYAPLSDELFIGGTDSSLPMSVIDVGRAVEVRTLTLVDGFRYQWRVTPDGARLVVPHLSGGLVLYDGRTGAVLATGPGYYDETSPVYDERFDRWYHVTRTGLIAFDRNLAVLASVPFEVPACGARLALSLHTDRLYVTNAIGRAGTTGPRDPMRMRLRVFDTSGGRLVGEADITAAAGVAPNTMQCRLPGGTSVVTAPGPPRDLTASASNRTVTLNWTPLGDATEFVLDVGTAPGRTDLRFGVGGASPATFANVPSGRYYLRVRGINRFGVSRASNEVTVVVP